MVTDTDWSRADTTPSIVEGHHMHYEVLREKESGQKSLSGVLSLLCLTRFFITRQSCKIVWSYSDWT